MLHHATAEHHVMRKAGHLGSAATRYRSPCSIHHRWASTRSRPHINRSWLSRSRLWLYWEVVSLLLLLLRRVHGVGRIPHHHAGIHVGVGGHTKMILTKLWWSRRWGILHERGIHDHRWLLHARSQHVCSNVPVHLNR